MKLNRFEIFFYIVVVVLILLLVASARAQKEEEKNSTDEFRASGGIFTLEKAIVAGGGLAKHSAARDEHGTTGQTVAGNLSSGGTFRLYSGFWTPDVFFAPTAATVIVSGRVTAADNRGIRNALVTVTFPNGETRTIISGASGRFAFGEIETGGTYVFSVSSKRFTFSNPARILSVNEARDDVNFVADN